ncbi:MAG TPA: protein kinase [Polyangiaceae bacterium]|nr:protein kinase [Polyangiaceae bacterium]
MAPRTDPGEVPEGSATIARNIGSVIAGTYRLTRHIGSGGSSHVFEAEHVRLGKPFAVKLLRPELDPTRQTAQRFRREARAIAKLSSEYIVNVVDCGELADLTPYLVMELLQGEDLRSLLKREGSLPARRAVPLIIETCRALSEAHGAGLVHRDLKPENLFITRRATGEDWCKVLDFGVAKMDASMSTTQGAIVGTVRYMAPEQLADGATVGPATDIHALGAILYECLSGRVAHPGETIQEAMFSVLNREPRALEDVPDALGSLVLRCLAKDPAQRPRSVQALRELLGASIGLRVSSPPEQTLREDSTPAATQSIPQGPRSRGTSLLVGAIGGVVLSASGLAWFWPAPTQQPPAHPTLSAPASTGPASVAVPTGSSAVAAAPELPMPSAVPQLNREVAVAGHPRPQNARLAHVASPVPPPAPAVPPVGKLDPANPYSE